MDRIVGPVIGMHYLNRVYARATDICKLIDQKTFLADLARDKTQKSGTPHSLGIWLGKAGENSPVGIFNDRVILIQFSFVSFKLMMFAILIF